MNWHDWLTPETLEKSVRIVVLVVLVLPLAWYLARQAGKMVTRHSSEHSGLLIKKMITYTASVIVAVTVLWELGFKLGPLLSAAGIAGIAIGFAAQTTLSNFISGFLLISEKPFQIGDIVMVESITGVVLSIDLMSVKVRTFDNKFVRLPSSQLIQNPLTNITRFPIRRLDINVGVAYKEDITRVRQALTEVADRNPLCLDEPSPLIIFQQFGDSSLDFMLAVWCVKTDFLALKNSIMQEIKEKFDQLGIEIPFPHRTIYTGEITKPFPIASVERSDKS
jgi:small-conductance mechanosensitive channel